ncbi:MAG: WYL domain-containing protein [Anaerolineae bacterium]
MAHRLVNRTERLAAIERMLLQSRLGLRAVEIAEACGVDRRTIYRDLSLLGESGVPVFQKDGRFFVNRDYYLAPVRLSTNEAVALFLSARMYFLHTEQPNPYLISALAKLNMALPETLAEHVGAVTEMARNEPIDRGFVSVLDTLTRAWSERRKVKLWYSAALNGQPGEREFATYFLEPTPSGGLFAVGYDTQAQRIRALNLRQIKRAKPLTVSYEIPSITEILPYLSSAWGINTDNHDASTQRVVLVFSAQIAPRIMERVWHESQHIELMDDGRCRFYVNLPNWREMLSWIRSWGTHVEVMEPQMLRDELAAETLKIANAYRQARI